MKTLSKRWLGRISDKGILSFLATGYAADDISEAPGGFSVFMFSPLAANQRSDQKSRVLQIRSMFGSTELDEDSVKYFAKNDFYLADSLAGLEEQIYTCIKCLDKLTCKEGIASEGYWHGFNMLQRYKREFIGLCEMDSLFPVKFAYLLDRAFQNFVQDLGDFHNKNDPIRKAKRSLQKQQVRDIDAAMSGFKTGSLSQLFLPRTLRAATSGKDAQPLTGGAGGTADKKPKGSSKGEEIVKEKRPHEDWWSKNPSPVAAWKLPEGKTFNDIFDFSKAQLKANTENWPKLPHHHPKQNGRKTYLCLKYQSAGNCHQSCRKAHMVPENIPEAEKRLMDDRFKEVYG